MQGLTVAGVDVLQSAHDGLWKIIEINDHPTNLNSSGSIPVPGYSESGNAAAWQFLALKLIKEAAGGNIGLLLPEAFNIAELANINHTNVRTIDNEFEEDGRIRTTIQDFSELARELVRWRASCVICSVNQLKIKTGRIYRSDGLEIHALWRRASGFPIQDTQCRIHNDIRQRLICGDKMRTFDSLSKTMSSKHLIPTCILDGFNQFESFIRDFSDSYEYFILKPRFGSAGRSLARYRFDELAKLRNGHYFDGDEDFVCQPWIQPKSVFENGFRYYFDIRLNIFDGICMSGFARRAIAPCTGPSKDTRLSWLTSSGKLVELNDISNRKYHEYHFNEILKLAQESVSILDKETNSINLSEFSEHKYSFWKNSGLPKDFRPVEVYVH